MRDTMIALLVLGSLIGAYFYFQDSISFGPHVGTPSSISQNNLEKQVLNSDPKRIQTQGVHDEGTDQGYSEQSAEFREGEAPSIEVAESKGLYSIYKGKSKKRLEQQDEPSEHPVKAASAKEKVVHGVPLQAWVRSQKNKILLPAVTADTGNGLRVFLQCLELKQKGPEYLERGECKALLVRHSTDRGKSNLQY